MSDSDDEPRGPANVTFRDLTPASEPELRRLNSVIFPSGTRYAPIRPSTASRESALTPADETSALPAPDLPPRRQQDKFYLECGAAGSTTQLAYIDDELVGAIACRLELLPDRSGARMYIMTVGVRAPIATGASAPGFSSTP